MRTITAPHAALLDAMDNALPRACVRVQVKDSVGTWRDLSTYPGEDFCKLVTWGETVDGAGMTASLTLRRGIESLSLSPLHSLSPLNHGFNPASGFAALLAPNREVRIEWALAAQYSTPALWYLGFTGYIDSIEPGIDEIAVQCSGPEKPLRNCWIERERVYAEAQGVLAIKGCYLFDLGESAGTAGAVFALNDLVLPSEAKGNGKFYAVTVAGTASETVEPTWPTVLGNTVVSGGVTFECVGGTSAEDGTAVETVMQQILNDNGMSAVTIYTPVSPGWMIRRFKQKRESVWSALRALSDQIGWDLRYKYDEGTSTFRLTFEVPDRETVTVLRTFTAPRIFAVSSLKQDDSDVRNVVRVIFNDSQDRDPSGHPRRKVVEVSDATSITAFGRRFMELGEASASNVDSTSEATTLANGALSDLKNPMLNVGFDVFFFPWTHLGDLYTFGPDSIRYTDDQTLAVVGYSHSFAGDKSRTTLTVHGAPTVGTKRWLQREGGRARATFDLSLNGAFATGIVVKEVVGGQQVTVVPIKSAKTNRPGSGIQYEIHVSTVANFIPDDTTLVSTGKTNTVTLADLDPGREYWTKVVPIAMSEKPTRGQPSEETSFVAGYLHGRHVFPRLDFRSYPLNGGFESPGVGNEAPDIWTATVGTFGPTADWNLADISDVGGSALGTMCVEFRPTAVGVLLVSGLVPVRQGWTYELESWLAVRGAPAAARTATLEIVWLDFEMSDISHTTLVVDLELYANESDPFLTVWQRFATSGVAPTGARWASVWVTKSAHTDAWFYLDGVRLSEPPARRMMVTVTFSTGTAVEDVFPVSFNCPFTPGALHIGNVVGDPADPLWTSVFARWHVEAVSPETGVAQVQLDSVTGLEPSTDYTLTLEVTSA